MRDLAARLGALADPTRLEMLALLLRHGELCVCDFVHGMRITQSKASRHLRCLWNAGLVVDRQAGLWVHYRITPDPDDDRRLLLKVLERLLADRDLDAVEARLRLWLSSKGGSPPAAASRATGRQGTRRVVAKRRRAEAHA